MVGKDIVERLRRMAKGPRDLLDYQAIREAADEIERLRAEVLRLSKQGSEDAHSIRTAEDKIERLQQERDEAVLLWQEWQAAAEQAERRVAELERTPKEATDLWPNWGDSPNGFDGPGGAE